MWWFIVLETIEQAFYKLGHFVISIGLLFILYLVTIHGSEKYGWGYLEKISGKLSVIIGTISALGSILILILFPKSNADISYLSFFVSSIVILFIIVVTILCIKFKQLKLLYEVFKEPFFQLALAFITLGISIVRATNILNQ